MVKTIIMNLIPSELEKYCKKAGEEIHIEVDLEDKDTSLRFVKGRYEMFGNTAVYLEGKDILALLELNGILGEGGAVKKILENPKLDQDKEIHDLIYITLAKYVLQMLNAAMGEILFPEIKPLTKHIRDYFRSRKEKVN
ncbi:MAG TPA: hypothetical protein VGI82_10045 [Chitinophagaceae bacterium]